MGYAYRHSAAPDDLIFTDGGLRGHPADRAAIKATMDAVEHHRETAQPIREKTGGSTFKNRRATSAWQLIDKAGCRGLLIGGAQVSEMHCNFLINTGTATGYDLEFSARRCARGCSRRAASGWNGRSSGSGEFAEPARSEPFLGHVDACRSLGWVYVYPYRVER